MEVKLVCISGKQPGREIPVRGPKYFIGRAEDCHLRPGSQEVSRHHAVILVEEGFVAVRDFGSRNGTFVNGDQVRGERELKSGDRLRIGPLEFGVQLTVAVGGKKKPKVASVREAAARTAAPAASGNADDIDITALFGEEDSAPVPVGQSETEAGAPADGTAVMRGGKKDPDQEKPKKKFTLKTPPTGLPAANSGSSEDAADDALQKFMSR